MTATRGCDGVLIAGFGGPTRSAEIRPFLDNVTRGRQVPRERYEQVVHHYEALGGRSPYNELTMRQAEALRAELGRRGLEIPIEVGMRNWTPYIDDALGSLVRRGSHRVLGLIMAAHRSEASYERYQGAIALAAKKLGGRAPEIIYPDPWFADPRFIAAAVVRVQETLSRLEPADRTRPHLVFTAHSIPVAMAKNSQYVDQLTESSRLVAGSLGLDRWSLAFQSRSGNPSDQWLEPEIGAVLRGLGRGAVAIVIPIGFLTDHVEVLYDLDRDAAAIAHAAGVRMYRAATVGDHPEFIGLMAEIVLRYSHTRSG